MKKLKRDRKERRIYYFPCLSCGKKRQTFSKRVIRLATCRKCRITGIPHGQIGMFDEAQTEETSGVNL